LIELFGYNTMSFFDKRANNALATNGAKCYALDGQNTTS